MSKILIIANLFGNNRQGYDLASALRGQGHVVRLVQYASSSQPAIGNYGVGFVCPHGLFSKFHVLRNMFSIALRSFPFRCDIIVCIGSSLLPVALFLKMINGADLAYYALEYCAYGNINQLILRRYVTKYIDVEEHRRTRVFKDLNISMPFFIIYNMPPLTDKKYDKGGLRCYLKKNFGLSGDEKIVLYAGSYQSYSCLGNIIEASLYAKANVVYVLMVAWGLPDDFTVKSSHCYLVPPQQGDEFFNWVSEADGMLLPYESSNDFNVLNCSPQKLFDCYLLGVPYLASKRPLIEAVHSVYEQAGCFCDFTKVESIVSGVISLVEMKSEAVSHRMMKMYRTRYNYSAYADKLAQFLQE